MKRVNTVRFSLVSKDAKNDSGKSTPNTARFDSPQARQALQSRDYLNAMAIPEAEYVALLRSHQNVFVHMQYLSGAAIVHDALGRQRILQMDEVAHLFLQLKDELTGATAWSRVLATRMRAESAWRHGNLKIAIVEFREVLRMLQDTPGLDVDKLAQAAMLHALAQAYGELNMPTDSEACYLEALGLYKRSLGRDHPKNFEVLHDLGALCAKDGYATEATELYERSYAGRMKTLGHNAPETLNSMQDLASLRMLLGDFESALFLLEKAVPALDTVFGLQNGATLNAMNQLSRLYQDLGLNKESRAVCGRTIPHCKTFFGVQHITTREVVVRYLQSSENFDFPANIKDTLRQYQQSRDPENLKVIHQLGRLYMNAGLNRYAADLFECLVDDFQSVLGPEALETFTALSALSVSREQLDSIEKAIHAYRQLVHMACKTQEGHQSRGQIRYAEKRIAELNCRRNNLAAERRNWGLDQPGPCMNCGSPTSSLCNCKSRPFPNMLDSTDWSCQLACKITRFCSNTCHTQGIEAHIPSCIPSVSLRESKSLAVKPRCIPVEQDQLLLNIKCSDPADINVVASFAYSLDPRNFTTFRMKLSSSVNTTILFSLDSDVQYATLDSAPHPPTSPTTDTGIKWHTPNTQDIISFIPIAAPSSQSRYLLVTPGRTMLKSMIDQRVHVRGGDGDTDRFRSLNVPSMELIEFAQGLPLTGYLEEALMYVVEWEWK